MLSLYSISISEDATKKILEIIGIETIKQIIKTKSGESTYVYLLYERYQNVNILKLLYILTKLCFCTT